MIRNLITEKKFKIVSELLGREYSIPGKIVTGRQLASKLGFPTVNLNIPDSLHLPEYGVYLVKDEYDRFGVANLGVRPTFNFTKHNLEVHYFSPPKIKDKCLNIRLLEFIRPEKKFANLIELSQRIRKDIETAKELLKNHLQKNSNMLK